MNSVPYTNQHSTYKHSNRFQNLHLNSKQNLSNSYLKSKYSSLSSKTFIATENDLQTVKCHKSVDKIVLETTYKKCREVSKLHQNGQENQQLSSNEKCFASEESLGSTNGNKNTEIAPILCNILPKVANTQNDVNIQMEDNIQAGNF